MTDILLLDTDRATELHHHMSTAADELDFDAISLFDPLSQASDLLGTQTPDVAAGVRRIASDLRDRAEDLHIRLRMVAAGGADMNAGFAALEQIRSHFTLIESRGVHERGDGILSPRDLQWARHQLDGSIADAANWLLEHPDFFNHVETAAHNHDYITQPYGANLDHNPKRQDGHMSLADIDAFMDHAEAWATLIPHAQTIDTAARGGTPDGRLSRRDFEAFLADYDLDETTQAAIQRVLDDGAYHSSTDFIKLGTLLNGISLIPLIGDIVDGARSLYHVLHGDWGAASIYALGLVPLPGLSGSGIKAGITVAKTAARNIKDAGMSAAAKQTGKTLAKGTAHNWTAQTAVDKASTSMHCETTIKWIAERAGVDAAKFEQDLTRTTGKDFNDIKKMVSDATGYDLSADGTFYSDSCETIAKRIGEHQLSKNWLRR